MSALSNALPIAVEAAGGFAHQSWTQRVSCRAGSRLDVAEELRALGCERAVFVVGPRANGHPAAQEIRTALWPLLADEFLEVDGRVPASSVSALAARADAAASDALVAFGGGACIDTAKSAARSLGQMRPGAPAPPVVVIPSTLVGAELTAVPGTPARIVLYDPEILARVGLSAVLSSGAAAIAHAVEALFAREDPLVETAACEALSRLATALPKFRDDPHDVAAATSLVQGGYLAAFAMARSAMGLAHGICRTIAGRTGVPYAIAHAIILPHAMRYNRAGAVDRLALAGRAIGAAYRSEPDDEAAAKACAAVERLVRALGLPGRLRDAGIEERGLLPLAEAALANPCMNTNPRPIETAGQILGVLRAAW